MKRLLTILWLGLWTAGLCAAENQLPVLKISFQGRLETDMEYVNGTMHLTDANGSDIQLPAKFKTRGATARQYMMKPSLNMKLRTEDYTMEADSALLGMRSCSSWILDAMAIDRICMRNRVAFDIWNEFSRLPYPTEFDGRNGIEGRFVELYINEQYYGIYCLTDRINRKLLNLKKVKEQEDGSVLIRGVLYKSGTQDIPNQNEFCYNEDSTACVIEWHNAWELSYPEEWGGRMAWQPLQDAILRGYNKNYVKQHFFLENLAEYQLLTMALCISDNWGNKNHFLSIRNINKDINDPDPTASDRRRFVITPWDMDTSFGGHYEGDGYDGNYVDWPVNTIFNNTPYPYGPICADTDYLSILKERWMEARRGAFSVASVCQRLEHYRDLFVNSGAWQRMTDHFEKQKSQPKYVLDLAREIAYIEKWYQERYQQMDAYFGITDGIDAPTPLQHDRQHMTSSTAIYDLQGRRISYPASHSGFYLHHGQLLFHP